MLKLYKGVSRVPVAGRQSALIERYLADACALVIIAKVVRGESITLTGVLKPVIDGKASVPQVARLALKSLGSAVYADGVRDFLLDPFIDPSAPPLAAADIGAHEDDDDDIDEDLDDDDDDEDDG